MNLNQLYYFKALAKVQHMTKTAKMLNVSQPSLSYSIKELEKEVGTALFEKSGRNIRLTKYGAIYLEYVEESLSHLEKGSHLLDELLHPNTGHIDLGFIYTLGPYIVPKLLYDFKSSESNKLISFSLFQSNTKNILDLLRKKEIDIALCSKTTNRTDIEFIPFYEEEIVLIVPKNHPFAEKSEIDLKEIDQQPFIAFNQRSGLRPAIDDMLKQLDVTPNILYEVEEDHTMAGLVSFGHGIALIPKLFALSCYNVKTIPIKNPTYKRIIYSATLKKECSPSLQRFKDFLIQHQ